MQNALMMMAEIFTVIFLYILLLLVNWKMTLVLTFLLGIKVLFLTKTISKITKIHGDRRNELQSRFYKILNETFGNFKIIKFIQNENKIYNAFADASHGYARTNIVNATLSQLPRNILEMLGFSTLVGVVVYILLRYENASFVLPIISMYALALYRMLPAINRILSYYNWTIFLLPSLNIMHKELNCYHAVETNAKISFEEQIKLDNVSFGYFKDRLVLKHISIVIKKGSKVAFVGESGSGKSTLVDLIMGIYKPTSGNIVIDGTVIDDTNIRNWRSKIGYIPQSIYLFDGTVGANVAFGYEYNEQKIIEALKKANIYDFLSQKDGLNTMVGDGGVQLSGGQRQRIAIARALYPDPEILVLDEATSALDRDTEAKIMDEIYAIANNKTLIVITHRPNTASRCDVVYSIKDGALSCLQ